MKDLVNGFSAFLLAISSIVLVCLIVSLPTMWLWNWLVPSIFGLRTINIWESLGLLFLSSIFLKNTNSSNSK